MPTCKPSRYTKQNLRLLTITTSKGFGIGPSSTEIGGGGIIYRTLKHPVGTRSPEPETGFLGYPGIRLIARICRNLVCISIGVNFHSVTQCVRTIGVGDDALILHSLRCPFVGPRDAIFHTHGSSSVPSVRPCALVQRFSNSESTFRSLVPRDSDL